MIQVDPKHPLRAINGAETADDLREVIDQLITLKVSSTHMDMAMQRLMGFRQMEELRAIAKARNIHRRKVGQ
jgi:hypothetical protein